MTERDDPGVKPTEADIGRGVKFIGPLPYAVEPSEGVITGIYSDYVILVRYGSDVDSKPTPRDFLEWMD